MKKHAPIGYDNAHGGPGKISKADRREATEKWRASMVPDSIPVGPMCRCSERLYGHDAHTSEIAIFDYHRSLKNGSQSPRVSNVRRRKHNPSPIAKKLERTKNAPVR